MMSEWLAWQIVDSAFPTGGFAHSWGIESAWQHGEIPDVIALSHFLDAAIRQAGHGSLPLVTASHREPWRLAALDRLADAFLLNPVANRASRAQGRTLIATAARVWPLPDLEALRRQAEGLCVHLAPMSGAALRAIGLPLPTAQRVVLYGVARGVVSAAVRLGIVGSYEAQRLQAECASTMEATVSRCGDLDEDDLAQTAPIADLLQGAHDRLYSRLFQT